MATAAAPQRDPDVVTYAAFSGLRSDVSPERFELGDLAAAQNVDIDKSGRLACRDGYTVRSAGAAHSLWADEQQDVCMLVRAGMLQRVQGDFSTVTVSALDDPTHHMSFTRISDRVYFSNGTDIGIYEAGAARSWGLPTGPLPGVQPAQGAMPAGTYQFALTWLRSDGQESGTGLAGVIQVPANGGVAFTLPISSHPGVVAKRLYVSAANGEVLNHAATVLNAVTSITLTGDPAALSEPLMTQFCTPPPAGQLIAHYRSHMFVAVGDTLYVSHPLAYELFDLRRNYQLDGRITMLAPMVDKDKNEAGRESGFFIGTDRSCGVLVGSDPQDFQYVPKTEYGAIFGALDYVDGALFGSGENSARPLPMFLTTQGLCIGLPDLVIGNLTRTKYTFPAAGRGAALFMPGPNRFIATANL